MQKVVSIEQMKARRGARTPRTAHPESDEPKQPQPIQEPQVSPCHPLCNHALDGDLKYVRNGSLIRGETRVGYGLKSSITPCPHCTPENERIRHLRRVAKDLQSLFTDANIPDYAKGWSFATFPEKLDLFTAEGMIAVIEDSLELLKGGQTGISLFLYGPTGAGKTSVAVSALRRYMEEGYAGTFLPVRKYIRLLQSSYNKEAPKELIRLEDLILSVPMLVFDDLGSETCTDWSLGKIFDVIEERGANGLVTIITSNNSLAALRKVWQRIQDDEIEQQSGRIIRRIRERFKVVAMSGGGEGDLE
jgi:DNA replication protein DnaC